jgi:hypothetical protein
MFLIILAGLIVYGSGVQLCVNAVSLVHAQMNVRVNASWGQKEEVLEGRNRD